jgi:hypothetical protein
MNIEIGATVLVVDQNGNVCGEGTYHGMGIPSRDLNAKFPNIQHFAVKLLGEGLRYYPMGYHTLIEKPKKR